jgi:hypothetical protein
MNSREVRAVSVWCGWPKAYPAHDKYFDHMSEPRRFRTTGSSMVERKFTPFLAKIGIFAVKQVGALPCVSLPSQIFSKRALKRHGFAIFEQ